MSQTVFSEKAFILVFLYQTLTINKSETIKANVNFQKIRGSQAII